MNRKSIKRTGAVCLIILLLSTMLAPFTFVIKARAESAVTLKLHYHRADGNYAPWDVWLWPAGGEGAGYPFAEEDGEMVATMEVPAGVSEVGFIVRTEDWTKDIADDQFIDITEVLSGTVHAYVESEVVGYKKEYADDVVIGTKLKTAIYDGDKTIALTFTGEINEEQEAGIEVKGKEGLIEIEGINYNGDNKYMLKLKEKLNLFKNYKVTYEKEDHKVNMPNIYSTEDFEKSYTYTGDDLGAVYSKEETTFKVWAPTAEEMYLNLYETGKAWESDLKESIVMTPTDNGTWTHTVSGDIAGTYYTYTAVIDGEKNETCDPYARTTGYNGKRAMVIDLASTNPEGWENDKNPHAGESINDAIIYEIHVRDFSIDASSGMKNKGKYLAFTETGTVNSKGDKTGVDYLKELGITHLHILPFYDYGSVDETKSGGEYNWGYDPVNYNVPEGSYATDANDGAVRVKEAKQMVKALHDNGISVVMDVVYNHVYSGKDFCMNRLVPGYFSRISADGTYSNGSGCGNDTASERSMVRKYIVDSVCYWADEYHIDGFRFDLVGLLDVDTINEIMTEVHKDHPDVIFYGEGWNMNTGVTKEDVRLATQGSSRFVPGFAFFNDNIRDDLKGSVFDESTGFVSGAGGKENSMAASFMGREVWCKNPAQIVNYASCHDNMTLMDRLAVSREDASREDLIRMNNLAAAFYMTAEGIPFMQAGEEILRTKVKEDGTFDSNSYASSDAVNSIKWDDISEPEYKEVHDYYKGLIEFRKAHENLRLGTEEEVKEHLKEMDVDTDNLVAFNMDDKDILIFNANNEEVNFSLPEGKWDVMINDKAAGTKAIETLKGGEIKVAPISALVLEKHDGKSPKTGTVVALMAAGVSLLGALYALLKKKNSTKSV